MDLRRSVYRRGTNLFFPTLFGAVSCTINWTWDMFHDCLDGRLTEFTFKPRSQIKPSSSPEPVFVNLTKSNPWTELRSKVMNVSRTLQLVKPAAWPTSEFTGLILPYPALGLSFSVRGPRKGPMAPSISQTPNVPSWGLTLFCWVKARGFILLRITHQYESFHLCSATSQ
jgi:hypothetical protein